ncbi:MAG: YdeI/OmpD-associated family protein [Thermocrispum sp.]
MSEQYAGTPAVEAGSTEQWRSWLAEHTGSADAVWLIMYRKGSGVPTPSHAEAVDQALCYGWIDSKSVRRDEQSRYQRFTPRRRKSNWSVINAARAEALIAAGRMASSGLAEIERAKQDGRWPSE